MTSATEIDLEWTFVAGDTALVERLRQGPRLEVIDTTFGAPVNQANVSPDQAADPPNSAVRPQSPGEASAANLSVGNARNSYLG